MSGRPYFSCPEPRLAFCKTRVHASKRVAASVPSTLPHLFAPARPVLLHARFASWCSAGHRMRSSVQGVVILPPLDVMQVRIGGYTRNADAPTEYQERRVRWTAVHPSFSTGFVDPITKASQQFVCCIS